ncbi:hypothetical protein ACFO5R_01775 [Halosolutus amylolyticus]|uniref:DUF7344 domain-containing protein n=1 Tax=Halosolutus amylolyticus TaxID=2932267 RepID=A0ABD5PJS3_9EURY|nr:hypothetical protein [Halosolutus amylolyticus]
MTIHSDGAHPGSNRPISSSTGPVRRRSLSQDDLRRVLDSDRRRAIVRCVHTADVPITVQRLVACLADAEYDATAVTTLHELRQRVHVSLHRTHLPALESRGIVTYDRNEGVVSSGANFAAVESILDGEALLEHPAARTE